MVLVHLVEDLVDALLRRVLVLGLRLLALVFGEQKKRRLNVMEVAGRFVSVQH